jgi:hypothetical protein
MATTALNRIVAVDASPLDAWTMKVTALLFCAMLDIAREAISVPAT